MALIADYGAIPLRSAIRSVYAQLRSRGQCIRAFRPRPSPPGPETAHALAAAARELVGELAAIPAPGARVLDALGRLERCQAMLAGPEPWPAELDRLKLPGNGAALSTDACAAYAQALAAYRDACAARAALPVRELMDRLLVSFGEHYAEAKRACRGSTSRISNCWPVTCSSGARTCAASTPSASPGSWSMSSRTPTGSSSS